MVLRKLFLAFLLLIIASAAYCEQPSQSSLQEKWENFLHYATIGRLALAESYAQSIIDSDPNPVKLLEISEQNPRAYKVLLRMNATSDQLRKVSAELMDLIEEGRYLRRTDPQVIIKEIQRLSTTIRGRLAAEQRLKNAGEFAIPFMIEVLMDDSRRDEYTYLTDAMVKIGRHAIRPLAAALNMDNVSVKAQLIDVLGQIGYPQALPYLKYIVENSDSQLLRDKASTAIQMIDTSADAIPATLLFFDLAEQYYYHSESLAPMSGFSFANVWFWNKDAKALKREELDPVYFYELMAMRCCEWSLRADPETGKSIALWVASFFKAESTGSQMPRYFGQGHASAMTYATTAGPVYLHIALDRALNDGNAYVALELVEALALNSGRKSLLHRVGTAQPLVDALSFDIEAVRYSAAVAIAAAVPSEQFVGSDLIIQNLAMALTDEQVTGSVEGERGDYTIRALNVMLKLGVARNKVIDLSMARPQLIETTKSTRQQVQVLSSQVLVYLPSPDAQRAIAESALQAENSMEVRYEAFKSLAESAKINGNLLTDEQIQAVYTIIGSTEQDEKLRALAGGAFGALNLPSQKVKDLILDQAVK